MSKRYYRNCTKHAWLVLALLYVIPSALAISPESEAKQPAADISVDVEEVDGKWQVRANMRTQLTANAFINLLDSAPQDCAWLHNCISVTLRTEPTIDTREIQTRLDSPWPFSDRLMLTRSVIQYNKDQSEVVVLVSGSDLPPSPEQLKNAVLVKNPSGIWRVTLVGDARQLSYLGSAEIDVLIPAFLLKRTLAASAKTTFENIHKISMTLSVGAP